MDNVMGLVGKWRADADHAHRRAMMAQKRDDMEAMHNWLDAEKDARAYADELQSALAQQPAGEAVAWEPLRTVEAIADALSAGRRVEYTGFRDDDYQLPASDCDGSGGWILILTEDCAERHLRYGCKYRALYTTPADSAPLVEALRLAEAALSDIGDADREPGDNLAWCERRAAKDLPAIRAALAAYDASHEGRA